jgi:hypothetical protein
MRPNTLVSAAPIEKISIIWTRLVSAFGFSNGCAELALKKPPPLVPSILMTSCEATGPARSPAWRLPAWSRRYRRQVLRHALPDEEQRRPRSRSAAGCRACSGSDRPRNCRWSWPSAGEKPRISATASAMPVAAEEVVHRQPRHLHQIAHRRFGHVGLPVGIGDEADRGVEGQIGADRDCPAGLNGSTACSRCSA